jgi:hypothetical protein
VRWRQLRLQQHGLQPAVLAGQQRCQRRHHQAQLPQHRRRQRPAHVRQHLHQQLLLVLLRQGSALRIHLDAQGLCSKQELLCRCGLMQELQARLPRGVTLLECQQGSLRTAAFGRTALLRGGVQLVVHCLQQLETCCPVYCLHCWPAAAAAAAASVAASLLE